MASRPTPYQYDSEIDDLPDAVREHVRWLEAEVERLRADNANLRDHLGELHASFEPVECWYNCEGAAVVPTFPEMLANAVVDLQADRRSTLDYRFEVERLRAELADAQAETLHRVSRHMDSIIGAGDWMHEMLNVPLNLRLLRDWLRDQRGPSDG